MILLFILWLLLDTNGLQEPPKVPYENVAYHFSDPVELRRAFITINPQNGDLYLFSRDYEFLTRIRENGEIENLPYPEFGDSSNKFIDVTRDGRYLLFWDVSIGRVHRMDLETLELERIDNSFTHRNMYYPAAYLDEDGTIYAAGGYGFWEFKNLLIRFDPVSGEWKEIPAANRESLPKAQRGFLVKNEAGFHYLLNNYGTPARHLSPLLAWQYSFETGKWDQNRKLTRLVSTLQPPFGISVNDISIFTSSYTTDRQSGHYGFLSGPDSRDKEFNLLDLQNQRLYTVSVASLGLGSVFAAFYSEAHGKWIILGANEALASRNTMIVRTFHFDPDDPLFSEVTGRRSALPLVAGTLLFVLILLSAGGLIFGKKITNGIRERADGQPVLILDLNSGAVKGSVHGNDVNPEKDEQISRLLELLAEMKRKDQPEMLITELDNQLFKQLPGVHVSYYSRNRKKMTGYLNEMLGQPFIKEKKSKLDKRYKVLSVDLKRIILV